MQNSKDYDASVSLAEAVTARGANLDAARQLIEQGADVNSTLTFGEADKETSVLALAAKHASVDLIRYLVEAGADLSYIDPSGYSVLLGAVFRRFREGLDAPCDYLEYLVAAGAPLNVQSKYGESLVTVCSNRGQFRLLKFFLEAGADSSPLVWTPLFHAVAYGSLTDVEASLQAGESVTAIDHWERTPFLLSVHVGRRDVAELLLARGSDRDAKGRCGMTALAYPLESDNAAMLSWLVDQGWKVEEETDEFRGHPLALAVGAGAVKCARELLQAGASAERLDAYGDSVMKCAGSAEMIELLYGAGLSLSDVSPDIRSSITGTPPHSEENISDRHYQQHKHRAFGRQNPDRMNNPFWNDMIYSRMSANAAAYEHNDTTSRREAVWCFNRFGHSLTRLPAGKHVEIGGEHEDYYDQDFCIYNDVVVHHGNGTFDVFGYPEKVFPPTDFHSATYCAPYIYIIGCLGYPEQRHAGITPIYRLHCESWKIECVDATGDGPGWIHRHHARAIEGGRILISSGKIDRCDGNEVVDNEECYILDTVARLWHRLPRQ